MLFYSKCHFIKFSVLLSVQSLHMWYVFAEEKWYMIVCECVCACPLLVPGRTVSWWEYCILYFFFFDTFGDKMKGGCVIKFNTSCQIKDIWTLFTYFLCLLSTIVVCKLFSFWSTKQQCQKLVTIRTKTHFHWD